MHTIEGTRRTGQYLLFLGNNPLFGNLDGFLLHNRTGDADFALLLNNLGDHDGLIDFILLRDLDDTRNLYKKSSE